MPSRNLNEVLQTVSDRLFPAENGEAKVKIDSLGSDGDTPLHIFIWAGETKNAMLLIENGAPLDVVGDMGETPLHVALRNTDKKVVTALMGAGAKTDIVSEFGVAATDLARKLGIHLEEST